MTYEVAYDVIFPLTHQPPPCDGHEWTDGWQKAEPSYRWTISQQWPDDIPTRACVRCGLVETTIAGPVARPCNRCPHQFRHHAVTADGYRCRGCKCKRRFWR